MKKFDYNKGITFLFVTILLLSGIYNYLFNNYKLSRIITIFVLIAVLYIIFSFSFLSKIRKIYIPLIIFIFFATYCARVLNFYSLDIYDKILHFSSGLLMGYVGLVLYNVIFINKDDVRGKLIFAIVFAIAVAGLWEVWEFSCDKLLAMNLQRSLDDTMYDIICGSLGGLLISTVLCKLSTNKNYK